MNFGDIANSLKAFAEEGTSFIYWAAVIAGIWLTMSAVMALVKKGQVQSMGGDAKLSFGAIGSRLVIASVLVTLAKMLERVIGTNGSVDGARQALAYAQGSAGDSPVIQAIWAAIGAWCVFIATIGFFRGWLLFDKASQGHHDSGDAFWRGLWHVVGGAVVIQIFS